MAKVSLEDVMFECPICTEEVDDTWRMLPCQHSFCLSCLHKVDRNVYNFQCPTCRIQVTTAPDELPRPRLLMNLYEKVRAYKNEVANGDVVDELNLAVNLSIAEYEKKSELESSFVEQEEMQLQIAVSQSAKELILEEKAELLELATAMNLSLQEYNDNKIKSIKQEDPQLETASLILEQKLALEEEKQLPSKISSSSKSNVENFSDLNQIKSSDSTRIENYCDDETVENINSNIELPIIITQENVEIGNRNLSSSSETLFEDAVSVNNDFVVTEREEAQLEIENDEHNTREQFLETQVDEVNNVESGASIPARLNIPDLSNHLEKKYRKPVLDTIVLEAKDENKLNSLKKLEVNWYLEVLDDYLNALKLHKNDLLIEMTENLLNNNGNIEGFLLLNDWNDVTDRVDGSCEDRDFALASELSRTAFIERNEETLLEIILEKSKLLDPVDGLLTQLLDIRGKLENRKALIESEN